MTTEPGFNELPYFEEKLKPTALRVASEVAIAEMMSFYPGRAESPSCWSLVLPIVLLRIGSIGVLPSAHHTGTRGTFELRRYSYLFIVTFF